VTTRPWTLVKREYNPALGETAQFETPADAQFAGTQMMANGCVIVMFLSQGLTEDEEKAKKQYEDAVAAQQLEWLEALATAEKSAGGDETLTPDPKPSRRKAKETTDE